MTHKPSAPAPVGEDGRLDVIEPDRLAVDATALGPLSVGDWQNVGDGERRNGNVKLGSGTPRQRNNGKVAPRSRILSAATDLFLRHGIAGVSVEAIARAAATNKPTFYYHFRSKDELVAEYLRESGKRLDAFWTKTDRSSKSRAHLSAWLADMADGLVHGWACPLTNAAAELKAKSHPARRVIKAHCVLQRRRLTRLCRAAGLRTPSVLADALLLLFDGACLRTSTDNRFGLGSRFILLAEAIVDAHTKTPVSGREQHRPVTTPIT